jgi:hypothetical protein
VPTEKVLNFFHASSTNPSNKFIKQAGYQNGKTFARSCFEFRLRTGFPGWGLSWVSWVLRGAGIGRWYSAGLRAGWSVVRVPAEAGNFSLQYRVQTGSGAHPASYRVGTRALSLRVKRPGREAGHSPPSSAEVKNAWSYTSTPPIRRHGVVIS